MTREPFIAHSELTNEIYIVSGREKYRVTEQAIKAVDAIKALEQEPKTGHWIGIVNNRGTVIALRCSCCDKSPKYAIKSDFCPHCGAKMVEPQESEDKE